MAYDQGVLDQTFQQALGRASTPQEQAFLKPYIDAGTITPYQIGQYLGSTPEALAQRQPGQQAAFAGALTQNNQQILSQAADAANASFAQNGRQFSSGQGNAVLQAGQQLAAQQSPLIAGNLQGQQGQLNSAYMNQGQDALSRAYGLTDANTQYARQMELYTRQANDYQNLLRQQSTRGLQGALLNGAVGLGGGLLAGGLGMGLAGAFGSSSGGAGAGSLLGGMMA